MIVFGDSLSDLGTYTPATINPQTGIASGGRFTTNPGAIWIEMIAAKLGLAITPNLVGFGNSSRSCPQPNCTGFAEGGARVTDPNGIGHDAGQMTIPLSQQMDTFLRGRASYTPTDLVFVYGGNNDIFVQTAVVRATVGAATTATGATPASIAAASQRAQQAAGLAVATAATELAAHVRDKIQAKGAKYIALMTLPDSAATPAGAALDDNGRAFLTALVNIFNSTLRKAVADQALNLLVIEANAANQQVFANPAQFGVTNTTMPACDLARLPAASSLFCNATTLIALANAGYLFADGVHPTSLGHRLFADYVTLQLAKVGWL